MLETRDLDQNKLPPGRSDQPTASFSKIQESQDPCSPRNKLTDEDAAAQLHAAPEGIRILLQGELPFVDETQNWHADHLWPLKAAWHVPWKESVSVQFSISIIFQFSTFLFEQCVTRTDYVVCHKKERPWRHSVVSFLFQEQNPHRSHAVCKVSLSELADTTINYTIR